MGRKLGLDKVLDCFSLSLCANTCVCIHSVEDEDEENEGMALVSAQLDELVKLKDFGAGAKTLAFHLEPKTVELRVSMHCYGCAKKVQKHISKMEGVSSFEVDLESKKVVVTGDITPYEVLVSVSKVMKFAELLVASNSPTPTLAFFRLCLRLKTTSTSRLLSPSSMDSKILYAAAVAALVAVSSFAGVAYAADSPAAAPGPATSGAAALSSSMFAASVLCPAVALLFANLRH